jgi:steroid delta-isomerase-like uncharacterized protein
MKTILLLVDVAAPRDVVFPALASTDGLARWWTTSVAGDAGPDGRIEFTFGGDFNPVMRATRVDPAAGVTWTCIGGVEQWADNSFTFELADHDGGTRVRFRQEYATELSDDDYAVYNYNWAYYLESLRLYCVTGTGKPFRPGGQTGAEPDRSQLTAVARRLAVDVFSRGDLDAYDEIFADDYVNHNIPVPDIPGTKAGFRRLVVATREAFPDLSVEVQDIVAEGDLVVFHDHVTATSEGAFFGVPPTGKPLAWTEIHFLRVRDGQIAEHWTNFDQLGILMQLGAIPSPG